MIDLSPLDIRSHSFKKEMRGYSKQEVNAFLEIVAKKLEDALFEIQRKDEKIKTLTKETENLKEKEALLQKTLISAQNAIETMKDNAKAECERIINEAQLEAKRIIEEANNEANLQRNKYNNLSRDYEELKQNIRSMLENFLTRLNN